MKTLYLLIGCLCVAYAKIESVAFPDVPRLETDRLELRQLTLDDVDDVFQITSDPEVIKLTQMSELHVNKEQDTIPYIQRMIQRYSDPQGIVSYWAVVHKDIKKVIGIIGFFGYSKPNARAEVGYFFARNSWGNGFATEALCQVVRFGFKEMSLNRIQASADPENGASIRVIEKNKMQREGLLKEYTRVHGEFKDRVMFAILKWHYENKVATEANAT